MPVVKGREYRNISVDNFTATKDDTSEYIVEGYATTFDDPYDFGYDGFETIDSHALDDADMSDVIFQYDHSGLVMARQRNNTLALLPDEHGLYIRADLKGSEQGRQLHEAIANGLVDRMSWAFTVADDGWEYDPATKTSVVRKVRKVYDVSAVSIPANDATEISARSYLDGAIEEAKRQEMAQRAKEDDARRRAAIALRLKTVKKG